MESNQYKIYKYEEKIAAREKYIDKFEKLLFEVDTKSKFSMIFTVIVFLALLALLIYTNWRKDHLMRIQTQKDLKEEWDQARRDAEMDLARI